MPYLNVKSVQNDLLFLSGKKKLYISCFSKAVLEYLISRLYSWRCYLPWMGLSLLSNANWRSSSLSFQINGTFLGGGLKTGLFIWRQLALRFRPVTWGLLVSVPSYHLPLCPTVRLYCSRDSALCHTLCLSTALRHHRKQKDILCYSIFLSPVKAMESQGVDRIHLFLLISPNGSSC